MLHPCASIRRPIVDHQLESPRVVPFRMLVCMLVYLYTRPERYSERASKVWALLPPTSVTLGHDVGQMDILFNYINKVNRQGLV